MLAGLSLLTACEDTPVKPEIDPETFAPVAGPELTNPSEYHEKYRTVPYPRENNELFVNPSPLIVPTNMKADLNTAKTEEFIEFELSSTQDFQADKTMNSGKVAWNMWNPHRALEAGKWYWRFRKYSSAGTPGEWSQTYSFNVTGNEPVFVTPTWETFLSMAPQGNSPRLYCFLDAKLPAARKNVTSHPEYASLSSRASSAVKVNYATELQNMYAKHDVLYSNVEYLYQAYMLTGDKQYADKLSELLDAMLATPCSSSVLYADDFNTSTVTYAHAAILDLLGDKIDADKRKKAMDFINGQCKRFYIVSCGAEENHIFNNHFWQINFRLMFFSALSMYDRSEYSYPKRLLQYLYELWTARAPASGFNRDGVWHNGTGYFTTNSKTLAYMALLLGHITRTDFTLHPWYRNAGQALAYTMPPKGANAGFGDGQEKNPEPNRQMAAFADFLARETGDGFASWYASSRPDLVRDDWELRIYRMCNNYNYTGSLPDDVPLLTWYKDAGEVSIHSSLTDAAEDLNIGFRSSQYGSGSHTTSSQNAFNIVYGGKTVFRSSGYYQSFSDAHNLLWYRHSRGHNTILVNGIGQPYCTSAYGRMLRAGSTASIAYALGDASQAYRGISDDPMWIENFRKAGVEQSVENGFGPTPLTRYFRHMVMLKPGIAVIYDELEASEAAKWEWLLHSPVEFAIDATAGTLVTNNANSKVKCRVLLTGSDRPAMSQTSKFLVPPATQGSSYPDQWHFTATVENKPKVRFLAIIQPVNSGLDFSEIKRDGNAFVIDNWRIDAALDPEAPATLSIVNSRTGATLDMRPTADAVGSYMRRVIGSTVISDKGKVVEMSDNIPLSSRSK